MHLSTVSLLSRQCRFLVIERLGSRYPSLSLYLAWGSPCR
nr:MAG TPA: hypothetical protein [Caudoviricetes sp.]DAY05094.1 MAG TPA: hypothetical protein [Caudoviricetes sp.]